MNAMRVARTVGAIVVAGASMGAFACEVFFPTSLLVEPADAAAEAGADAAEAGEAGEAGDAGDW